MKQNKISILDDLNCFDIKNTHILQAALKKDISEKMRAVVSWSCHVTTKKCPMIYFDEEETQQHSLRLLESTRSFDIS